MSEKVVQLLDASLKLASGSEVSVFKTQQSCESDAEREKDFGSGTFTDAAHMFTSLVDSFAGRFHPVKITCELSPDRIQFYIELKNREHAAIFIGKNAQNVQMLFNWLRVQQVYPHNRKIQIVISKLDEEGDDQIQSFWDLNDGFWGRNRVNKQKKAAKNETNEGV